MRPLVVFGQRAIRPYILCLFSAWCTAGQADIGQRVLVRLQPDSESAVISLLTPNLRFELQRAEKGWVKIRQGDITGWIPQTDLPKLIEATLLQEKKIVPASHPTPELLFEPQRQATPLLRLFRATIGDSETHYKLRDPFYRDRVTHVAAEWGPIFYVRTRYYYVRGIRLINFSKNRLHLALAKRRLSYNEIFGSLWSDDFLRVAITSNRSWLGNEKIFGKGREYFLELSLDLE